jgi:hypothetical protein
VDKISIELSHDELTLMRNALSAFMGDFGHKEHEIRSRLRELLGKVEIPQPLAD